MMNRIKMEWWNGSGRGLLSWKDKETLEKSELVYPSLRTTLYLGRVSVGLQARRVC